LNRPVRLFSPAAGLLVIGAGTLVVPLDSAVNVAFPAINRAFNLPIPAIQWIVISYTLTYAALMLVFGRIGDMLGYRRIFLLGAGWSVAAFILCALAGSFPLLLAARTLQGVGAAMILSCGPALATSLYPEASRTRVLGIYTMMIGAGSAIGPPLAGLLVQQWGWESVFWFRAPLALVAFLAGWRLPRGVRRRTGERFDIAGAVLLVLAISFTLLTLNQLRGRESLATLVVAALIAVLAAAGFIVRERHARHPIIALHYFRGFDFSLANGAHSALNLAAFSILLLMPFYFDRFGGLAVSVIGVLLGISNIGVMVASPIAGRMAARHSPRRIALAGAAAMAVGQLVLRTAGAAPDIPFLAAGMLVQGAGLGLFQVAYFDICTATIPREDRGVAGSLVMVTRTLGVVTGATVLMLVFESLRDQAAAGGASSVDSFLAGFHAAFSFSAALPCLVLLVLLLRGWWRGNDTKPLSG
jgi:MFS family permease